MRTSNILCCVLVSVFAGCCLGRPATFQDDFRVTWADSHIKQLEGGRAIQLTLDQNSGIISLLL